MQLNIDIFSTVGDVTTAQWVNELDPVAWKISSGLLTHISLIHELTRFGKTLFMSTGMASKLDIDHAVKAATDHTSAEVILFQCTSIYPTPDQMLNLRAIRWLENEYKLPVGFSDHSGLIYPSLGAATLGAEVFEFHVVFDKRQFGPDVSSSITIDQVKLLTKGIRQIQSSIGSPVDKNEIDRFKGIRELFGKSLSLNVDILNLSTF